MNLRVAFLVALIPLAMASPLAELDVKPARRCRQSDTIPAGPYTLAVNSLLKHGTSPSGSVCAQVDSQSRKDIAWSTIWSRKAGNGQSYANVGVKNGLHKQLSAIQSIQSSWSWSQSTTSVVANVAYQLTTSFTPKGADANEIRIWLAKFNVLPISRDPGKPVPVKSGISLAEHSWDLYVGPLDGKTIFTFVPSSGTIPKFSGDLKVFLAHLVSNQDFSSTQYLTALRAGTAAISGSATFKTTSYHAVIN